MPDALSSDLLDQLRDYVDREIRGGFTAVGDIPQAAVAFLADEADPNVLRPHAEQCTAETLVALTEEQRSWPEQTDCDRLDVAFARLESAGILARQDFSCCQNCGHGEMWALLQEALAQGRSARGYTFYHQQDTESAVEGYGLCLAWGATEAGDDALASVGHEVVAVLRAEGLRVGWDGSTKRRISLSLDWKRRRE